jgi:hypothetical protein
MPRKAGMIKQMNQRPQKCGDPSAEQIDHAHCAWSSSQGLGLGSPRWSSQYQSIDFCNPGVCFLPVDGLMAQICVFSIILAIFAGSQEAHRGRLIDSKAFVRFQFDGRHD